MQRIFWQIYHVYERTWKRIYRLITSMGVNNIIDVNPTHSNAQNHRPFANNKQTHPSMPIIKSMFPTHVGGVKYIITKEWPTNVVVNNTTVVVCSHAGT